jgi:ribosome recycling factor
MKLASIMEKENNKIKAHSGILENEIENININGTKNQILEELTVKVFHTMKKTSKISLIDLPGLVAANI